MHLRLVLLILFVVSAPNIAFAQTPEYLVPPPPAEEGAVEQPCHNILLIIIDDVGVDNVSCYGEGANPPHTPNIDTLARTGVLFRNAWSNPTCTATRAGINTGRYGFRTGVGSVAMPFGGEEVLALHEITLPEVMGPCGYPCGLIGKWHLGNRSTGGKSAPLLQGWDYHVGTMWHSMAPRRSYYRWPRTLNGRTNICRTYATTQTTNDALSWIGRQNGPWFCCLSYNAAHKPFHAPPSNLHSYALRGLDPDDTPLPHYLAAVQAMDTEIGRLLHSIADQLENTTVILIGDNGTPEEVILPPYSPERAKFSVYEGGIHVPIIISGAGVRQPGRESHGLVSTVDLFATIIELAGHNPNECAAAIRPLDSVSMLPYLVDPETVSIRDTVYSERFRGDSISNGSCAIRNWQHKLICHGGSGGTHELYDLADDPYEMNNLLRSGEMTAEEQAAYVQLLEECSNLRSGNLEYAQGTIPVFQQTVSDPPERQPEPELPTVSLPVAE